MSTKKIIQRVVVGGVLINSDKKALILQRHSNETVYPNMWELPSGKREYLEPTLTAVVREFKEEAGVTVKIIAPISVFDYIIEKTDETRDSTRINFLVELVNKSDEVSLSEEHQKYDWVGVESLENFNLTDSTKQVLREAFAMIER